MDGDFQSGGGVVAEQRRHISLHQGLGTSFDDVDAPLGSLKIARNVKYFAHRRSFGLSAGRQYVGSDIPSPTQGIHSPGTIVGLQGFQWDPDESVSLHDIVYISTENQPEFKSIEPPSTPGTPINAPRTGFTVSGLEFGPDFESTSFENDFYLATGKDPFWMVHQGISGVRHPALRRWGMAEVTVDSVEDTETLVVFTEGVAGANKFAVGDYWYWFTWVILGDALAATGLPRVDIEGTHSGWDSFIPPVPLSNPPYTSQGIHRANGVATESVQLYVNVNAFDGAIPSGATHVRIYRGIGEIDITKDPRHNPWPTGSLLETVPIVTVRSASIGVKEIDSEFFYLLYKDNYDLKREEVDKVFNSVTVRLGNISAETGMDGAPPRSTAVETFEESIIANDIDDLRKTRFSFPGKPHSFPAIYYINHESTEQDQVVAYRVLKNTLGVFLRYGIDRVNWLPRQSDADFNRGRVKEAITRQRGLVNRRAITKFQHPMFGEMIAYMSDDGLYVTDLRKVKFWAPHLNWTKHLQNPETTLLIDDPDNWRLILAHQSPGDAVVRRLTFFHYDPAHLTENGTPAIVGPVDRTEIGALTLIRREDGKRQVVTTDGRGNILYEGFGLDDQAGEDTEDGVPVVAAMQLRTQDMYPSGLLHEASVTRFGFRGSGVGRFTGSMLLAKRGVDQYKAVELVLDFDDNPLVTKKINTLAERVGFEVTGQDVQAEITHLAVLGDDEAGEMGR